MMVHFKIKEQQRFKIQTIETQQKAKAKSKQTKNTSKIKQMKHRIKENEPAV